MKHFRRIWDEEKKDFLKSTKGMKRRDAWEAFRAKYPECEDITEAAFYDQRSRCRAANSSLARDHSRRARPLWSEQIKKGYVRIKIAQPNVWVSKAKWVYMETHPWEDYKDDASRYIFLDGDNRNFSTDNIARMPLHLMAIYNNHGGTVPGNAEATRLNIAKAKLIWAIFEAGDKLGLVADGSSGRVFKAIRNARAREYSRTEKNQKYLKEYSKKRWQKIKSNPDLHEKIKADRNRRYKARKGEEK